MAIVALVALVVVIVIGTWKKINLGIMGIVGACVLALISQTGVRDLVAGFNTTLFLRLLGIQLLICAAQSNGTMETLAKKLVAIGGKKSIRLIPVIIYFAFLILGYCGIDIVFLATPFILALAFQLGVSPLKLLFTVILGFHGSGISPLATSGVNTFSVAEKAGLAINGWNCAITTGIASTIVFVAVYFIFGWHKEQNREIEGIDSVKFNLNNILTLLGFVAYVVLTMFLKMDILVAPTLITFVLLLVGAADGKKTISSIPWNVLIMIGGMSMMSGMVAKLGGVELLTKAIASVKVPALVPPLMLLVAGLMSFFSSGNGVVIPTLIPTVTGLSANTYAAVTSVCLGACSTGTNPFSTIGGHIMSCYDAIYKPTEEERAKTNNELLIASIVCLVVYAVLALVGVFNITIL